MRRLPVRFLLCACIWELCFGTEPPRALEVDVLNLNKESKWTSNPASEFNKITMPRGTGLMLQACGSPHTRSALSAWTERGDAAHLYLDITFALSASGEPVPLKIHLLDSSFPSTQISARWSVLELNVSRRFPAIIDPKKLSPFFLTRKALSLGPVRRTGFQLGLSYRGACVLVSSIRVFYKKCPDSVLALSSFSAATGGSGPVRGSCVQGAVEGEGPPERNCSVEGVWGPQQGQCVCGPGHQPVSDHCQACDIGFYKWANQSGGCQKCPLHSHTLKVGSDSCECVPGFSRLPSHPYDLGCAKPPSAPLNVTAHHYNDSMLVLMWDPPLDRGGRLNVSYHVRCETRGQHGSQWKTCDGVLFLLDSLTTTSVNLSGINAYQDYKLSVEAWNDISSLQGAPLSSTATVTIQRWRAPPVVTPVNAPRTKVQVQEKRNLFLWVFLGVMFGVLLLLAVIPITVCIFQRKYSELRPEQDVELTPLNPRISYRRPEQASVLDVCMRPETAQDESVLGLLEGLGERLATSLKEVLVERRLLTLGKELGKGEFGSVYEAVFTPEENVSMKVAVKTMRVGFHSQEDLHGFLREAEIMKSFNHDNVVRLLGVTLQREEDSSVPVPLVILPYMKHGDLRRFLIATRYGDIPMFVPYQTLLRFMVDIAEGMDYLSSQGFLHRDLAARNCMLGDDLKVCVADFGLSKKICDSNYYRQKDAIRVPIKWMAIESLSESVYTTKSDVWSFGITMWEIVSRGRTPYPGVHNYELLDLLLTGYRLKAPDDCDHKLWEVMYSCWEKEPTQRPCFRELVDTLKALLSELPVLEACQEATYINHGLEAAAVADFTPLSDYEEHTKGNVYLAAPVATAAALSQEEDVEIDSGYLKCLSLTVSEPEV